MVPSVPYSHLLRLARITLAPPSLTEPQSANRARKDMARKTKGTSRRKRATTNPAQRRVKQYPKSPLPAQHQRKPGLEYKLKPRPEYQAPAYKAAGKLEG